MPGDGIFLIHDDETMVEMQSELFDSEAELQSLLSKYPGVMAGGQINPASPRRWVLVAQEVGVPSSLGGGNQWSVDHLFLDQDAIPTIVEVKRSTDTRIRREVVGQMLDYAANGVRYWPIESLRATFDAGALARKHEPDRLIAALIGGEEADSIDVDDVEAFWGQVQANLLAGRVRMLFVADIIPAELQRIIEFLNEQMSPAEVLGVELRHYRGEGVRTLVPRVVGATATSRANPRLRDGRSFEELLAAASEDVQTADNLLTTWAIEEGLMVRHTPKARQIYDPTGFTLLQFYVTDGFVEFHLKSVSPAETDEILAGLERLAGKPTSRKSPLLPAAKIVENWGTEVISLLRKYVAACRSTHEMRT